MVVPETDHASEGILLRLSCAILVQVGDVEGLRDRYERLQNTGGTRVAVCPVQVERENLREVFRPASIEHALLN